LTIRDTTFPGWCGVTFVDELPLLRLMAHARGIPSDHEESMP
jgi:hypothetical protein